MIDLSMYEKKLFSQNGEDGVTAILIDTLFDTQENKYYVEFGVENGMQCNTHILRKYAGWTGLLMDGGNENIEINLQKEFITKENIISLFNKYNVRKHINLLCVDIDFNDFYVLKEILKEYTADIIICEYNATHLPYEDKVIIYDANGCWDGSNYAGVSLLSLTKLCNLHGYSLVYCNENGVNAFFVRDTLIKERGVEFKNINNIDELYRLPKYGRGPRGGHREDTKQRQYITYEEAMKM